MNSAEIMARLEFGKTQKIIFVLSGCGWGISAAVGVWVGLLLPEISSEWDLSYVQESLVPIFFITGMFIGCYFWGALSDQYGRSIVYRQVLIFSAVGSFLACVCNDIWLISLCFLLIGFGCGGSFTVDASVFLEYTKSSKAHFLIALSIFSPVICAYSPGLCWGYQQLGVKQRWRLVQATLGLTTLILAIPRFWIKETPMFLLSKINFIQEGLINAINEVDGSYVNTESVSTIEKLKALFREPLKKYTYLYMIIWAGVFFTYNGINSFLPEILKRTGFKQDQATVYEMIFFVQIVGFPAIIIATYSVKMRPGRKWTLFASIMFSSLMLFGLLAPFYSTVLMSSLIYYFMMNACLAVIGPITLETFPVIVRNTAFGLINCTNNLASVLGSALGGVLLQVNDDITLVIFMFSIPLLISAICVSFVLETKGFDCNKEFQPVFNKFNQP